jgi:hypothetical protein
MENVLAMRLLVFDDPTLPHRYDWLIDGSSDVHASMRALPRQAYRRNRRGAPRGGAGRPTARPQHRRRPSLRASVPLTRPLRLAR